MAEFVTQKENQRRMITLIVCIIISTISLITGIYAYKSASDLEDKADTAGTLRALRTEIEQKRAATEALDRNYHEFSVPIGWANRATGTYDRHARTGVSGEQLKMYLDMWVKELSAYNKKDFKKWVNPEGGTNQLTLTELYKALGEVEAELRNSNAALTADIAKAEGDAKNKSAEIETTEKANLEVIDKQLKEDYKRLLKELGTKEKTHGEEIAQLESDTFTRQRELTELKNRNLQDQTRLEHRRRDLITRIDWIQYRREEAKERKDPDGEILAVDGKYNVAFIDLVHKDRIFNGSRFRVYSLEKGGQKFDKGEIEVIEVRDAMSSKVAIIKTNDATDPIKVGDRIYNEYYEKGKTRYVAIAGRFSGKLSNEESAARIREFGDIYQARVDEKTNYLVVGEGYEQDPNWDLANEWGVKVVLERTLYDYLGVP